MTSNGGLPHEYLNNLRYMLKKGVKMKLVLMGLDDFSFRTNPAERLSQPFRRHPYPPVLMSTCCLFMCDTFSPFMPSIS